MYESFFELKCKPFSLLPDPDFLFLSSRHSIALSLLEYSLTGQAGFCVITGEVGSGKTTLVRAFLGRVGREFSVGLISNTHQQVRDIAAWALTAFGQKQSSTNPAEVYQELMAYLIAEYGNGRQCILIVDEAQNLSVEALEELRLLSNINSGKDLLLQILLVGQPELLDKLKRPELRQFAQRIAVSHHLSPLAFAETRQYIDHRLSIAGASKPIFSPMAIGAVQYFSGGVPRLINSICDLCLVYAFADGVQEIDEGLVFRVITDRQLSGIAPFAHANPADDAAVRAEISVIANSEKPAETSAAGPSATATDMGEALTRMTAAAPAVPPRAPAAMPAAIENVKPMPIVEAVQPISIAPRRSMSAGPGASVLTGVEPHQRPEEFYFDGDESDLLLTCEADKSDGVPPTGTPAANDTRPDEGRSPRVVVLHAEPADRLSSSSQRVNVPRLDVDHPFPATDGHRTGSIPRGDSLRVEETLLQAAPSGTAKPSERSWWRRAFRREG